MLYFILEPAQGKIEAHLRLVISVELIPNIVVSQVPISATVSLISISVDPVFSQVLTKLLISILERLLLIIVLEQIAQAEAQKVAEAPLLLQIPGIFKDVARGQNDFIKCVLILDHFKSFWVN